MITTQTVFPNTRSSSEIRAMQGHYTFVLDLYLGIQLLHNTMLKWPSQGTACQEGEVQLTCLLILITLPDICRHHGDKVVS